MPFRMNLAGRMSGLAAVAWTAVLLAGCSGEPGGFTDRSYQPLSPEMLALMHEKGMTEEAPVLIRSYKKEAEFEIWKMQADGQYALLKTYPMCRWSGQLGPKRQEGDRQVPEGFYWITPAQMNPHSNYYLSFNVGYPNAYDRAHGRDGGAIMVHGACSSAGCFSMTDQQIGEIYALAREAFAGGQRAIQMQSLPFHMTPENFAKYRLDPNIDFWKELKVGTDNFEVTRQEVKAGVCNGHYVFDAEPANGGSFDPTGPCPPLKRDEVVQNEVLAKQMRDDAKVAELVVEGVRPVHTVYADGGQNPSFASRRGDVSRPEALAQGPVDVAIDDKSKNPTPAQLKAAEAKDLAKAQAAAKKAEALRAERGEPVEERAPPQPAAAQATSPQPQGDGSIFTRLFTPQTQTKPAASTETTAEQAPQMTEPQPDPGEASFARFYSETQPARRPAEAAAPEAAGTVEAVGAPIPPLRKQRAVEDAAASGNPADQPTQSQETQSQSTALDGATTIVPGGSSSAPGH